MNSNDEGFSNSEKDIYLGFYSLKGLENFSFIYGFGKRNALMLK